LKRLSMLDRGDVCVTGVDPRGWAYLSGHVAVS
jgi:hypothetical protein